MRQFLCADNELDKLYNFHCNIQTVYFERLIVLNQQYENEMKRLVQQKESLQLKIEQAYQSQIVSIKNRINCIILRGNCNAQNDCDSHSNQSNANSTDDSNDPLFEQMSNINTIKAKSINLPSILDLNKNNGDDNQDNGGGYKNKNNWNFSHNNNNINDNNGVSNCQKILINKTKQQTEKTYEKMNQSSGKTIYKCNYCNKVLTTKSGIVGHYYSAHTRKYQCDICQKCFASQPQLSVHHRIHSGIKPFQCNYCAKLFATKGNLMEHYRTHTGEKPYKCKHCNKAFAHHQTAPYHQKTCQLSS